MAKAVPDGHGTVTPFLTVRGAKAAIEFYKAAFDAQEISRMPGPGGMIMHAEIQIGTSRIMLADAMMGPVTQAGLHIYVEDCDALWARATEAGCTVEMPLAETFWGDRYGIVVDKYGNRWSIATHKEDVPPEMMRKRMAAEMAKLLEADGAPGKK
jgi:uncharacterized glyoxalase superfamily protein PhnB